MSGSQEAGMNAAELLASNISRRVLSAAEYVRLAKLSGMQRNTLRNYPFTRVWRRKGAYGVSLGDGGYLRVLYSPRLTATQQRDLLALLATWLVADPNGLIPPNTLPDG